MRISDEMLGEMIYRALYQHQGGLWECVSPRHFWYDAASRLRAALSALSLPVQPVAWRKMDTAPRDGTHILARASRHPSQPPTTVHWFGGAYHLSVNAIGEYSDHGCGDLDEWMPLATWSVPALAEAAMEILHSMASSYKAGNNRQVSIQADDGEKCWIVHSEQIEALRSALTTPPVPPTKGPEDDLIAALLPLRYEDGPDYCTVTDKDGGSFALTVRPDALKAMEHALLRSRPASALPVVGGATHRHVKTGGEYALLGIGRMQSGNWTGDVMGGDGEYRRQSVDMREVAIYRGADGELWARPREEFEDGRFAALTPSVLSGAVETLEARKEPSK